MRFHRFASLAAGAALCAATASAQDRAERFVERDLNRDGVLSPSEYTGTGGHPGNFRALDVNNDGVLSRGEFVDRTGAVEGRALPNVSGLLGSAAGPEFQRMDRNRDSLLTRAEWSGDAATFRRMDANDDRYVTTSEYVAYHRAVNEGQLVKDPAGVLVKDAREFRVLDYDDDGRLTRREWNGDRREFDAMDLNNDGLLTYNEYVSPVDDDLRSVRFRDLDRNRDGRLTRAESGLDRSTFGLLDRNNDGRVTREEFRDTRGLDDRFSRLDRDRDGRLERREWQGTLDAFRWFDRNRDGRVTRDEFLS
jgi:YD repeat-containing protein